MWPFKAKEKPLYPCLFECGIGLPCPNWVCEPCRPRYRYHADMAVLYLASVDNPVPGADVMPPPSWILPDALAQARWVYRQSNGAVVKGALKGVLG